jgi:integrase
VCNNLLIYIKSAPSKALNFMWFLRWVSSLFHAAATHMVDNDADIRHVQEFLGHASISTTQLYLHVSKAKLHSVYAKTHPRAD